MEKKDTVFRIRVLILSTILLVALSSFMLHGLTLFKNKNFESRSVQVLEILRREDDGQKHQLAMKKIYFRAEIMEGKDRGAIVEAEQQLGLHSEVIQEVQAGDRIVIQKVPARNQGQIWIYLLHKRLHLILWLAVVFGILVLLFGLKKGLWALLALFLTFGVIFFVFIPSIIKGYNIYLWSTLTCLYSVVTTILLVSGRSPKSLVTILGCGFGILCSASITLFMNRFLALSGAVDEQSIYLWMLNPDQPIDLTAIIFGAILIGAMGAIMDVAMDISSSLFEITQHAPSVGFKPLFKSGLTIGRDIMGTMVNTLILAYIGSSLGSILLLLTYSTSLVNLLNQEMIIVEMLQALVGSTAILLTMPLTAFIAAMLYRHPRVQNSVKANHE